MRGDLLRPLNIVQHFTAADHVRGAVKTNENYRRPQVDELHRLCEVISADRVEYELVVDFERRKLDLFANDINVHAQTAIELGGPGCGLSRRPRRLDAHPEPSRRI